MSTEIALGLITILLTIVGGIVSVHPPTKRRTKWVDISIFVVLGGSALFFVVKQSRETAKTSGEILELANKAIDTATGGNSYCYITIAKGLIYPFGFTSVLVQRGKYPLYDVRVGIANLTKYRQAVAKNRQPPSLFSFEQWITIGDLAPGSATSGPLMLFSSGDRQSYNIFFSSRNGFWEENLRLRWINGHWAKALRLSKFVGSKLVYFVPTIVDEDFPRMESGKMEWDK